MSIKLIKASYEYQDLIVDMLKEWIDYNNNHPEANTSPASIFKNDYHNFDYYINNLDLKNPKPGLVEDSTFFAFRCRKKIKWLEPSIFVINLMIIY